MEIVFEVEGMDMNDDLAGTLTQRGSGVLNGVSQTASKIGIVLDANEGMDVNDDLGFRV